MRELGETVGGVPRVDIPVPDPRPDVDADTLFDRFASFVTTYPRVVAVLILLAVLAAIWKRPLWRGVLIGALALLTVWLVFAP